MELPVPAHWGGGGGGVVVVVVAANVCGSSGARKCAGDSERPPRMAPAGSMGGRYAGAPPPGRARRAHGAGAAAAGTVGKGRRAVVASKLRDRGCWARGSVAARCAAAREGSRVPVQPPLGWAGGRSGGRAGAETRRRWDSKVGAGELSPVAAAVTGGNSAGSGRPGPRLGPREARGSRGDKVGRRRGVVRVGGRVSRRSRGGREGGPLDREREETLLDFSLLLA